MIDAPERRAMTEAERIARRLTEAQGARLLMYRPETYAISFSRAETRTLENLKLIEWVPRVFGGNGVDWRITDLGRAVAAVLREGDG
jgi:hypothetical protein